MPQMWKRRRRCALQRFSSSECSPQKARVRCAMCIRSTAAMRISRSASRSSARRSRRPNSMRPKIIVFASGTKEGRRSGFENLVTSPELDADILAVKTNHEHGGVRARAEKLGIPFIYFAGPCDAEHYRKIVTDSGAEWAALSGWLRKVEGLDPRKTFNIHPALLSFQNARFGGPGLYGHRVH